MKKATAVILHNVRSVHNVGAIFRTADAAGVEKIFLTGYTPLPLDRFNCVRKDLAKTALGAEKIVVWEHARTPQTAIKKLKKEGWTIVGVEQDARSKDYKSPLPEKCAFVFGNEVKGLSRALRDFCDVLVEIPMRGKKESLNVSVAAGIILFSQ